MGIGVVRRVGAAGMATVMGLGLVVVSLGTTASTVQAEAGGVDQTPVMGWSSWSFLRMGVDTSEIEGEAQALVTTGLAAAGYRYVNIDDNWYECPGPQGPNVDQYGRWVINGAEFPSVGNNNGMQVVSEYVHSLGLKFGVYETPGISDQAVAAEHPYPWDRLPRRRYRHHHCTKQLQLRRHDGHQLQRARRPGVRRLRRRRTGVVGGRLHKARRHHQP